MSRAAMDRSQAQDARVIEQVTRWTLAMLQNAQRGLVPLRVLQRTVDPAVLASLGPIAPPRPGQSRARVHVGGVRIHLVHDGLAHVASTAIHPDGRTAGYVLEFRRDRTRRQWRVTEMTQVDERRLVGPDPQPPTANRDEDRPRRYPADLAGLIQATQRARADAERALAQAQHTAGQLKQQLATLQGKNTWKGRGRAALTDQERAARADAARWQRAIKRIDDELATLYEVRELREVRQLVIDGDPLVRARKPQYLEQLLGPVPADRDDRAAWRQAASIVERYRQAWHITDRDDALGRLPNGAPTEQARQRQLAAEAAQSYVASREHEREREQTTSQAVELEI